MDFGFYRVENLFRTANFVIVLLEVLLVVLWIGFAVNSKRTSVIAFVSAISAIILLASVLGGNPVISLVLLIVLVSLMANTIRVVNEYQRGVLLRFGKFAYVVGPGINVIMPFGIDRLLVVDLRTATIDVPRQEIITKDNIPVMIDAVVYFNVFQPELAVLKVQNYFNATSLLAQTILRAILGKYDLDDILAKRQELNEMLREELDRATDPWGVKVTATEIKSIELPEEMKRAMAKQAEAERERRAKIIRAEGELQAAEKLSEAASIISRNAGALQLRQLQTLTEIAVERNSTIIFPLPLEIMKFFVTNSEIKGSSGNSENIG
ncbi:slipin family protein [Thermosediminibacter oceani]|uniref:SPFH domain, Band 7 family protein n=1 Tax=Thermosediminibacter oceani (strain ATCC BAA-1034 / DSM 16646 / JW/IW-1228P) TaxID=555079 RepID=D9RZ01_THEOJ|nr:slipin family protein [Thermosediminibacter oceani]ADL08555.1 SPFH domain, Band 7 family protein [Thermosediminibacter oceani DSM 16646]